MTTVDECEIIENKFKTGDIVASKSGGPPLYVMFFYAVDQTYACRYYNGMEFKTVYCRESELDLTASV